MLIIVKEIIIRLLLAIPLSMFWNFFSFLIMFGLYRIKDMEIPEQYNNMFNYISLTNYIIIFICLIFLFNTNSFEEDNSYKIDSLNETITSLENKLTETESELEELQENYNDSELLVEILKEQLEENGIEPNEL